MALYTVYVLHATTTYPDAKDHALVARLCLSFPTDVPVETVLEMAFEKTNTITHQWSENEEVTKTYTDRLRSTSVGDVFMIYDASYRVSAFGFEKIIR